MPNLPLFDECKAAQAAAFFLYKAGGVLPLIKLMKLMCLTESLSMQRYGSTITGDKLVHMPLGPVLLSTYGLMTGTVPSKAGGWSTWVAAREDYELILRDPCMMRTPEKDFLALTKPNLECLGEVWVAYGHQSTLALKVDALWMNPPTLP